MLFVVDVVLYEVIKYSRGLCHFATFIPMLILHKII